MTGRLLAFAALGAAAALAGTAWLNATPGRRDATLARVGLATPRTRGFMDATALAPLDVERLKAIRAMGSADDRATTYAREGLTRRDVELLRQDRRRAEAAYPDVKEDDLLVGAWMPFLLSDRVPASWGGSNLQSTTVDGEEYLDGDAYLWMPKPEYSKRATVDGTEAFFARKKVAAAEARRNRKELEWSVGGSGGSESVRCSLADGCVVERAEADARVGTRWEFPFVPSEWAASDSLTMDEIRRLPSFARAKVSEVKAEPTAVPQPSVEATKDLPCVAGAGGVTIQSTGNCSGTYPDVVPYSPGMTLMPGQSTTIGVTVPLPQAR